jgi:hypothetical protein
MKNNVGIIFTGIASGTRSLSRPAGAFRIRTWLGQHGYHVEVIDYFTHFSYEEIEQLCKKYITNDTLFVGVSVTFFNNFKNINFLFDLVKTRYPHVKTIVGGTEGPMVDLDLKQVDRFIWGYAEEAILHYTNFLKGKRLDDLKWVPYKNNSLAIDAELAYKNDDTDLTIKWINDDLLIGNFLPVEISRGCIFRCRFCQYPLLGKKKNDYIRHEDNLADEFRRNWEEWGIDNYSFQDDTFNDNIIKLEHVANAIAKSGIKITYSAYLRSDLMAAFPETISMLVETGLISTTFGVESLNEKSRIAIGKGGDIEKQFEAIKKLKSHRPIWTHTGMIAGLPSETIESLHKSQEWFFKQNGEIFDTWQWWPLGIRAKAMTRLSEFEKNYKRWGYTIDNVDDFFSYWKNSYMNFNEAHDLSIKFNEEIHKMRMQKNVVSHWENWGTVGFFEPAEAFALGIRIEDMILGNVDTSKIEKTFKQVEESIKQYKQIKLSNSSVA